MNFATHIPTIPLKGMNEPHFESKKIYTAKQYKEKVHVDCPLEHGRGKMNNYCGIQYIFHSFPKHSLVPPMCQTLGQLHKDMKGIYIYRKQKKQEGGHECLSGLRPNPVLPRGWWNSGMPPFVKLEAFEFNFTKRTFKVSWRITICVQS